MRAEGGSRIEFDQIPPYVREALSVALGSPVVAAHNQPGGFSPGLAARCGLADGRRVFIKAVSPAQNEQACRIHRREIEVASALPSHVNAPTLLHTLDDGEWVVLVFEEIDGRQPSEPWSLGELDLVMAAIHDFHEQVTPSPVPDGQSVEARYDFVFHGWRRIAGGDGTADTLPPWCRTSLDRLADLEAGWSSGAAGDTLLHTDLRADNVLIGPDGTVTFVDWPWACVGAPFVDALLMVPSIGLGGGPDPATVIDRYDLAGGVDPEAFLSLFVAVAGFFARATQDPPPPGLPSLRAFQRAQGDVALGWLAGALT